MKTLLSMKSSWSERNYWWNLFSFVIIKTSERTLTTISWKSFISQPRIDRLKSNVWVKFKFSLLHQRKKFDTIENRILHYLLFTCFTTIGGKEENKTHFPWLYLIYIYIYKLELCVHNIDSGKYETLVCEFVAQNKFWSLFLLSAIIKF